MPLLTPALVRELELMRRSIERRVASRLAGQQQAPRRGGQAEFFEHRTYGVGDDMRKIDWSAFARSGEPVVKVFRSEEDSITRLLMDTSASLGIGNPHKLRVAAEVAASLGYLSLSANERAQVLLSANGKTRFLPSGRGRQHLGVLLKQLEELQAAGENQLAQAIDSLLRQQKPSGQLVVLSDFFEGDSLYQSLGRARHAGHAIVLVQFLADEEVNPVMEGQVQLIDNETNERIDFYADAGTLARYQAALEKHNSKLRVWARKNRAAYVQVVGRPTIAHVIRRILRESPRV